MADGWRDAEVLVTGARGFLASHLCRRLVHEGARVHGVSRAPDPGHPSIRWRQLDIADPQVVRPLIADVRPDFVFHLAGHVSGSQRLEQIEPTLLTNLASTVRLLTAVAETGRCRTVMTGSMHEPHPGDPTAVPCSPYAASKTAASAYARMFHALYQLPIGIARPFMAYGPGQWDLTKLLPYVIVSLLRGESPKVGGGTRALDWVFVDDVIEGMLLIARSEFMDARTIDLGCGELVSIRCVIERVVAKIGSDVPVQFGAIEDRPLERRHAAVLEETQRLIGWLPQTTLERGLDASIEWYRLQLANGTL